MSKVQMAIDVAIKAHSGQIDKVGEDYINHPLRVHRNLLTHPIFETLSFQDQDDAAVAAIMHDVIEDSGVGEHSEKFTKQKLIDLGFTARSIEVVELLTRSEEVHPDVYYEKINADPLAKLVKWSDIADNLNIHRTAALAPEKRDRLAARYEHALEIIKLAEEDKQWLESAKRFPVQLVVPNQ